MIQIARHLPTRRFYLNHNDTIQRLHLVVCIIQQDNQSSTRLFKHASKRTWDLFGILCCQQSSSLHLDINKVNLCLPYYLWYYSCHGKCVILSIFWSEKMERWGYLIFMSFTLAFKIKSYNVCKQGQNLREVPFTTSFLVASVVFSWNKLNEFWLYDMWVRVVSLGNYT